MCGISNFEIPQKILLKPNMLSPRRPEEAVTTHPLIVKSVGEIFKEKEIIIGDSPANTRRPIEDTGKNADIRKSVKNQE